MEIDYARDSKERVPFEHYYAEYQQADPLEISRRTGAAWSEEEKTFRLKFLGVTYALRFPDFDVKPVVEPESEEKGIYPLVGMNDARILVMRFLLEGCSCLSSGKFLTFSEVPTGEVYERQFNGRCVMRLARTYGKNPDRFSSLIEKLGAKEIKGSDAGYEIALMEGFLIRFQLWAGDEEFPASAQIQFSDNFAAAFCAEDLVVSCDVILNTLNQMEHLDFVSGTEL